MCYAVSYNKNSINAKNKCIYANKLEDTAVQRHSATEEQIKKMREFKQKGMSCRQIAQRMGFGKSTVSEYTKDLSSARKCRRLPPPPVKPAVQRHDALYDVKIYLVRKRPDLRIHVRLDHRPTYTDMMRICSHYGLRASDFADDRGTGIDDRIYHGTVYTSNSGNFPLARFTICHLRGEVYIEDFFR